ncbi:hypothetical protein J7M02_07775 [Candidatus Aerophobetes bacterium]|nr:hypothetical protein [Candidatus Aerophobetes bacterium]
MKEVKKIHYSEIEEILSPKLVVYNKELYITKEDLRDLVEWVTLIEIPEFKEEG